MAEETFTVTGIHCAGCQASIEAGLRRLDGVRGVQADHRAQTIRVRFDERRLGRERLAEQLERIGYTPIGASNQ
jgi:copper chaperone CopZ